MRHANRPSSPGKPLNERKDAASEQEGLDEVQPGSATNTGPAVPGDPATDPTTGARHAERAANTPRDHDPTKRRPLHRAR
jgi:hypothetical protein